MDARISVGPDIPDEMKLIVAEDHSEGPFNPPDGQQPARGGQRSATSADREVGVRIRALRIAARMTQSDIARRLGITTTQMHRYEVGATRVAASRLIAIAQSLGVPVSDLVGAKPALELDGGAYDSQLQELVRAYRSITTQQHRLALVQLARSMAAAATDDTGGEV